MSTCANESLGRNRPSTEKDLTGKDKQKRTETMKLAITMCLSDKGLRFDGPTLRLYNHVSGLAVGFDKSLPTVGDRKSITVPPHTQLIIIPQDDERRFRQFPELSHIIIPQDDEFQRVSVQLSNPRLGTILVIPGQLKSAK